MKLFAYILSFVVLALTAIPCVDVSKDNSVQKTELSNTTSDNHQSDTDHCSPFCTCQCCQTSFYVSNIAVTFTADIMEISYNEYSSTFQSIDLFDFLIPPKS
ncbi:DUF6660 family protein [Aquipluma nitroreducens]|jgi:hypothetical protein|uniref:DUF6660 family protein n=1 Tax=Aquipluma nitroreducens TaxID=2010828 RepID=UPI00384DDDBF